MDAKTMRALGNHLIILADSMEKESVKPMKANAKGEDKGLKAQVEQKKRETKIKEKSDKEIIMTPEMVKVKTFQ